MNDIMSMHYTNPALQPYKGPHAPLDMTTLEERLIFEKLRDAFDEIEDGGRKVDEVYVSREVLARIKEHLPKYFLAFDHQNFVGILWGAKVFIMTTKSVIEYNNHDIFCVCKDADKKTTDKHDIEHEISKFDVIADV